MLKRIFTVLLGLTWAAAWVACAQAQPRGGARAPSTQAAQAEPPSQSGAGAPRANDPHGADINEGKSPAQIFQSDCAVCHKSPNGLAKDTRGLAGFLRQHYTTGEKQASAIAGYLSSLPAARQAAPAPARSPVERSERPERERGGAAAARQNPSGSVDGLTPPTGREASKPADAKPEPKPSRRPARHEQAAKPPEPEKPAAAPEPEKPAEAPTAAAAAPPPVETKPAAPPPPEIPL